METFPAYRSSLWPPNHIRSTPFITECRRRPCAVAANLCFAGKQALSSLDNCYRGEFLANSPSAAATSSHRITVVALPSNESIYLGDRSPPTRGVAPSPKRVRRARLADGVRQVSTPRSRPTVLRKTRIPALLLGRTCPPKPVHLVSCWASAYTTWFNPSDPSYFLARNRSGSTRLH